jgi:hypothetical protein
MMISVRAINEASKDCQTSSLTYELVPVIEAAG